MDMMNEIKMTVANNLKKYRQEKNLTQKQLAEELSLKLGIDLKHNTISSWENGTNSIDTSMLKAICDILGIDINIIYGVENIKEPTTIAAHFDGEEYTEEEMREILEYAKYIKSKRKQE